MNNLLVILFVTVIGLRQISGLSCPCWQQEKKCDRPPPTDCKGDIGKDVCGCCDVCAKVEGEKCGGPFWSTGRCSSGLICKFPNYDEPIQSDGICVPAFLRKLHEPCGDAWQQGNCEEGLKCDQLTPGNIGKCIKK